MIPINPDPAALVFGATTGAAHSKSNVCERVLHKAIDLADLKLVEAGHEPLPDQQGVLLSRRPVSNR
jgi:hypothetical protein